MKALSMQCLAVLLKDLPLAAAVRDAYVSLDQATLQNDDATLSNLDATLPNLDAFVTTHNWRCKANKEGKPACIKYHRWVAADYLYCYLETGTWDYCTLSPRTTAYGKTCQDIEDVHSESPSRSPYAWCITTEGSWDYCRYPAAEFSPDADYNEMKALTDVSEKVRTSSSTPFGPHPQQIVQKYLVSPDDLSNLDDRSLPAGDGGGASSAIRAEVSQEVREAKSQMDYEADMNRMVNEQVKLEKPCTVDLRTKTHQRKWCDWETAGWNNEDREFAKKQTEDEWQDRQFRCACLSTSCRATPSVAQATTASFKHFRSQATS